MKFTVKIASSVIGISLLTGVMVASAGIVPGTRESRTVVGSGNGVVTMKATSTLILVNPIKVVASTTASCPVVTSFLKMGAGNDSAQVLKLQAFLKNDEGFDVDATGIFDAKTEAAVHGFQKKYMNEIMTPWGATRTTGSVYVTTAKKINQLACGSDNGLSSNEKSMVASYNGAAQAAAMQNEGSVTQASVKVTTGLQVGTSTGDTAASNPSLGTRFWNFLKSFFQR